VSNEQSIVHATDFTKDRPDQLPVHDQVPKKDAAIAIKLQLQN